MGPEGYRGQQGIRGDQGLRGQPGVGAGETGQKGPTGDQGPVGPRGPVGPTGPIDTCKIMTDTYAFHDAVGIYYDKSIPVYDYSAECIDPEYMFKLKKDK